MDALWLDVSSSRNAARSVKEPLLALLPLQGSSRWGSRDHGGT